MSYTQRMPAGVCGLISPWNLPLYLLTWKIAPAIAFGNTCVCKPSEFTSVTAWMLCPLLNEAGVPPGVINMVFGTGHNAGAPLVQHPDVPIISFTGGKFSGVCWVIKCISWFAGTVTGETITRLSAPLCKKLSLELGNINHLCYSHFDHLICSTNRREKSQHYFRRRGFGPVCCDDCSIFICQSRGNLSLWITNFCPKNDL